MYGFLWKCWSNKENNNTARVTQHTISLCLYTLYPNPLTHAQCYTKKTSNTPVNCQCEWEMGSNRMNIRLTEKTKDETFRCVFGLYECMGFITLQLYVWSELLTELDFIVLAKQNVEYWPDSVSVCTRCSHLNGLLHVYCILTAIWIWTLLNWTFQRNTAESAFWFVISIAD